MTVDELQKLKADAEAQLEQLQVEAYKLSGEHRLLEKLLAAQQPEPPAPADPTQPVHVPVEDQSEPATGGAEVTSE
jgi:hypothetical protein